ncbi:MAG: FAD-binding protein [Betaproteobacteria bacterium]|nr:MAG: FAD-binding protein [Betaproteobacteria bacterium]
MSQQPAYPMLLSPFTLAGKRLRNRVVHASMTTRMGQNTRVTDRLIQYYANRARGGAALIVTEPLSMARHQEIAYKIRAWNDENVDDLKRWADAVESADCRLLAQIQDPGRGRHTPGRLSDPIGASAQPDDLSWTVPRALRVDEIEKMTAEFADASARVQRCGFSGVEISCGHGHLFHQFLSPWSNLREDQYGGDVAGRTRFVAEIIAAVRAACGREFIVGLKLPGDDGAAGSIDARQAAAIALALTRDGTVDYLCFAQGSHARSLEMHVPDGHAPRATYMPLIRELRASLPGIPVVALGRITDPAEAEGILVRGDAELIGLGRPLVTDPAWVTKAASDRAHDIRYCVACNSCWGLNATGQPLACDNNPRVAEVDELDYRPPRASVRRRVVVIGTGVAGLEAAWVAAARGHNVTVFGRSQEVGGKTRLRASLPGGEALSSVYDYQYAAALRAGAKFELGVEAAIDDVLSLRPDAAILATGSSMIGPRWLPEAVRAEGWVLDLPAAMCGLAHVRGRQPGTAVIFDMDHSEGTYACAERLHALFDRVVIVTPRHTIADETAMVTRQGILRRISRAAIEVMYLSEPRWTERMEQDALEIEHVYTGVRTAIEAVAFLAYSTPRAPVDALLAPLRAAGIDTRAIGDCLSARNLMAATAEGHAAGHAV